MEKRTMNTADIAQTNSARPRTVGSAKDNRLFLAFLVTADVVAIVAAFALAHQLRFVWLPYYGPYSLRDYATLIAGIVPIWLVIFAALQLYNRDYLLGGTTEYAYVFNAVSIGMVGVIVFGFFLRDEITISRGWLIISWLVALVFVGGTRFTLRHTVYALRRHGYFTIPSIVVGANEEGQAIARQLIHTPTCGARILGFVDNCLPAGTEVMDGLTVLGPASSLPQLVHEHSAEELVVATTTLSREQLLEIFQTFGLNNGLEIRLSSGLFEILSTGVRVKEIGCVPLVSLNKVRLSHLETLVKAALDYGLAIPGLLVSAPFLLLIALLIKLDSPGPVFHRRKVLGVRGQAFHALKFRTMLANADEILNANAGLKEEYQRNHKLKDDPRITRLGRFLRRYSIDELPQLINVLLGQMSLVGPRMISPEEEGEYGRWKMNLLTVKPGITGLWQVSGRSDVSYSERVRLDMNYIRNYNIWLDLQILLFRTLPAVLKGRGAY
jgi:exopolysaccharide biosynthesis polyprenyl glycosylphosphotransferase